MPFTWPWRRAGNAPARLERKNYGYVALHGGGEASWSRRDFATLAHTGYMGNPVAHRAVRLVAESCASVPFAMYQGPAEVDDHPLLSLLARPNPRQNGTAFLEALYGYLALSGNAYVEAIDAGDPQSDSRELHLLRPDRVSVATDSDGWPAALDYRQGSGRRRIPLGSNALHLGLFHPLDDHYGFAPLEAALAALDTHNAAGRWNKALLDNSARPSGALVYAPKEGGGLSDEQFDRLKTSMEDQYQGAARAGRPLILEGGLDWKQMSLTPKDMDFIEAKNAASRDIALALGVPPMLLGIPGDNTYSNYQEANRAFYRLTVLPQAARMMQALADWLAPGESLRLTPDIDQIGALSSDRDSLWARIGAAGFLSDEEKRAAVGYRG